MYICILLLINNLNILFKSWSFRSYEADKNKKIISYMVTIHLKMIFINIIQTKLISTKSLFKQMFSNINQIYANTIVSKIKSVI